MYREQGGTTNETYVKGKNTSNVTVQNWNQELRKSVSLMNWFHPNNLANTPFNLTSHQHFLAIQPTSLTVFFANCTRHQVNARTQGNKSSFVRNPYTASDLGGVFQKKVQSVVCC